MADAGENELSFLQQIGDVLKSIDKESHDVVNQKMTELKIKLEKAREFVDKMPGIQCSKTEQLKQIDVLRNQLTIKTALLEKYKNSDQFDLNR
ncbi:mediator of RNA polymerase II transcription subunit 9-like [Saccostrea cucullata]|uniref:mediator of RNA polymerase II transcription subunit 9-like n=1 Tax=Saccostrea echinata TaxID=191078 RepID=UPI002A80EB27|nr:mediator of RNA polymerase II transcription subunit 9-like [Saccostrea echinata]